jgi:hypothetical protein
MKLNTLTKWNTHEKANRESLQQLFRESPLPTNEMLLNLGLYLNRQALTRILFMHELYQKIVNVHGVICEFGVRWGQNLALYESLRGIYEPYNYSRRIVGFDTFEGFPSVHLNDGASAIIREGAYNVTQGYRSHLEEVLNYHESESPIPHIRKYELVQGDACVTIHEYLKKNPQTVVSFAYFDFDIYEPTRVCLEAIVPHLTKGSVIGFDEVCHPDFPGETIALREVLGERGFRLQRSQFSSHASFLVIE